MRSRHLWTAKEAAYLRQHYPGESTKAIAKRLKQPIAKVYAEAHRLGLTKTEAYVLDPRNHCRLLKGARIGKATRFKTGHLPANKGLRRPGYASGRMRETWFRKGERSGVAARNWKPVGTILRDTDGYPRIKVREAVHGAEPTGFGNSRVWPLLERHVWAQHHGPIPPKYIVTFKDRDRSHCVIENLELISMAENARRNAMWNRLPQELVNAIILNGALKRKLRRLIGEK